MTLALRPQGSPRTLVGRMTEAMRAATPAPARGLRVGLISGGRVVEERLLRGDGQLVVGTHESATLVVSGHAPPRLSMFERTRGRLYFRFCEGMKGRVALGDGALTLDEARRTAVRERDGSYRLELGDDARGSVTLGDATLLFQLAVLPASAGRPGLPISVMPSLFESIDWPLATLAAVSFLLHFGAVGTLYSDWGDRILPLETEAKGLVESLGRTPPPKVDTEQAPSEHPTVERDGPRDAPRSREARRDSGRRTDAPSSTPGDAALAALARMNDGVLGALAAGSPVTARVLAENTLPTGPLDLYARSDTAPGSTLGIRLPGATGPLEAGPRRLADLGPTGVDPGSQRPGESQTVAAPRPVMTDGGSAPRGGKISGYESALRGARGRVRRCYEVGLSSNGDMQGTVAYTITVSSTGAIGGVRASSSGTLSPAVASCVEGALRGVHFDAPEGGLTATITGSYSFVNGAKR